MRHWKAPVPEISSALGGDGRRTARCPVHGDRKPSLSLGTKQSGEPLVHCFAGCDWRDVQNELERQGWIANDDRFRVRPASTLARELAPRTLADPAAAAQHAKATHLWDATLPVSDNDPAGQYLLARHCALPSPDADLRWLPARWPRYPQAMIVGRISDVLDPTRTLSLQFTPISPDGTRGERRFMSGLSSKGVVRLCDDGEVTQGLFVAEGIETALSGPMPAWATLNAGNLGGLPVLHGVVALTIIVDADPAGRAAADQCAARWYSAGSEVRIYEPETGHGL